MSQLVRDVVPWAVVVLVLSLPADVQEKSWRIMSGEVHVLCPLTVGGSFDATTTVLEGVVAADASGRLTGALEVDRGQICWHAVLSAIALDGADLRIFEGETAFSGTLRLHGVERPVSDVAELARTPDGIGVAAHLPVALQDHVIQAPRYLGVGVTDSADAEPGPARDPGAHTRRRPCFSEARARPFQRCSLDAVLVASTGNRRSVLPS